MSSLELSNDLKRFAPRQPQARPKNPRAIILLGGGVGASELCKATRRTLVQLPIDTTHSILDLWQAHATLLAGYCESQPMPIRYITNQPQQIEPRGHALVPVRIESDPREMRGTGGVLRDVIAEYSDDTFVAVASASQILLQPLAHAVSLLTQCKADLALLSCDSGDAGSLLVARCAALRAIPEIGFIDLKEQGLPAIAKDFDVRVVHRPTPIGLPVRTVFQYIAALHRYHKPQNSDEPFAERWAPSFSIVEPGAAVDPSAKLHDAVVLRGAVVQAGAVVARSVVCPGGFVAAGEIVLDQLVQAK